MPTRIKPRWLCRSFTPTKNIASLLCGRGTDVAPFPVLFVEQKKFACFVAAVQSPASF